MKIRILKNSIRFRLKQPEVEEFRQKGIVMEVLEFGEEAKDKLSFGLAISTGKALSASFRLNTTTIHVPGFMADEWTGTEMVGFDGKIDTGMGKTINVLVEKDFKCLDERDDDEGAYPNPNKSC